MAQGWQVEDETGLQVREMLRSHESRNLKEKKCFLFLQICIINGGSYCHLTSTLANVAILAAIGQFLLLTKNCDGDEKN